MELRMFLADFNVSAASLTEIQGYDARLKYFERKLKLLRRLKATFEAANYPGKPANVSVEAYGPSRLLVTFDEPEESSGAMIIEYSIEWSLTPNFDTLVGRVLLTFVDESRKKKQYVIKQLEMNRSYYVRVSCANIRGYGPVAFDFPPFAIPSCNCNL